MFWCLQMWQTYPRPTQKKELEGCRVHIDPSKYPEQDPKNKNFYTVYGEVVETIKANDGTDTGVEQRKQISISVIRLDITDIMDLWQQSKGQYTIVKGEDGFYRFGVFKDGENK